MHLRSGKNLDTKSAVAVAVEPEPAVEPAPAVEPSVGPSEDQYTKLICDGFNILMDILQRRNIKSKEYNNDKSANQSELEIIIMNQIRILTEIYYLFSHYSDLIFAYIDIDNVNAEYAKRIVLAALSRINVLFNQLMRYEFIEKYKFVRILDPLYHEWEECIRIYGIIYEKK